MLFFASETVDLFDQKKGKRKKAKGKKTKKHLPRRKQKIYLTRRKRRKYNIKLNKYN